MSCQKPPQKGRLPQRDANDTSLAFGFTVHSLFQSLVSRDTVEDVLGRSSDDKTGPHCIHLGDIHWCILGIVVPPTNYEVGQIGQKRYT